MVSKQRVKEQSKVPPPKSYKRHSLTMLTFSLSASKAMTSSNGVFAVTSPLLCNGHAKTTEIDDDDVDDSPVRWVMNIY